MKKTVKKNGWLGILAIVLVFGMTVVRCDDGSTDDNGENENGNETGNGNGNGNGTGNGNGGGNTIVTLNGVTANGSTAETTTQLNMTFSQSITGLSASNITLSGVTGVIKGTLGGSGPVYTLPISGFTQGGTLTVAVAKSGYTISGSPKTVPIFYYSGNGNGNGGTDGRDWTAVTNSTFGASSINAVAWGNGKYVAVGESGKMAYSSNGVTWTAITDSTFGANSINAIAWGGPAGQEQFVAVGASGKMATSPDGTNWTAVSGSALNISNFTSIAWGGPAGQEKFIAGGYDGKMATSSNGASWSLISQTFYEYESYYNRTNYYHIDGITWGNDKFVAVMTYYDTVNHVWNDATYYSTNGTSWTIAEGNSFYIGVNNVGWGNGTFVSVGTGSTYFNYRYAMRYSTNGTSWTGSASADSVFGDYSVNAIIWGGSAGQKIFVAVGNSGKIAYSPDGITWTAITNTAFTNNFSGVTWGGPAGEEKFVAVGSNGAIAYWLSDAGGGNNDEAFTSIAEMATWLAAQLNNTIDRPYTVKLNVSSLGGSVNTSGSAGYVLEWGNSGKYVSLDLSGSTITTIPDSAFSRRSNLTSVTIPNSVTSIGENAFSYCANLTSVTIPSGVTEIGDYAFSGTSLTSVTFEGTITPSNVGDWLAPGDLCNKYLAANGGPGTYTRADSNSIRWTKQGNSEEEPTGGTFTSIDDMAKWLRHEPANTAETAYAIKLNVSGTLSNSVKNALSENDTKTKYVYIDLSDSTITDIGFGAFSFCYNLIGVTIPDSVTSIGDSAFQSCNYLTSVTIPDGVTSIGNSAFGNCTNLASVTIGNGVITIGTQAFRNCPKLTSVTIGNSVTSIGDRAFESINITSIIIPDSVTSIGIYVFQDCTRLTSVTIGNGVTSIEECTFAKCTSLTSVTIGNSVASIGEGAFLSCTRLASVTIPASVTSIGTGAFNFCTGLNSVTFEGDLITAANFSSTLAFLNDLRSKYLATNGGIGTYIRAGGYWTKQP